MRDRSKHVTPSPAHGNGIVASAYEAGFRAPPEHQQMPRQPPSQQHAPMAPPPPRQSQLALSTPNLLSQQHAAMAPPTFGTGQPQFPIANSMTQTRRPPPPPQSPSPSLPVRKAKRHRKRHVPVGPAGLWFERQQQRLAMSKTGKTMDESFSQDEDEEVYYVDPNESWQRRNRVGNKLMISFSPAWSAMQCERQWIVPSIPLFVQSVEKRYKTIRPHVPSEFLLLPDVLDRVERDKRWRLLDSESIMVLVDHVQAHHWLLWSVTLTDETGATMEGWIQPDLVRDEEKKVFSVRSASASKANQKIVQANFVWELVNCAVVLKELEPSLNEDDQEELERYRTMAGKPPERMLLIGKENIKNVWTPDQVNGIPDDQYCAWMEARSALDSPSKLTQSEESAQDHAAPTQTKAQSPMTAQVLKFPEPEERGAKTSGGIVSSAPTSSARSSKKRGPSPSDELQRQHKQLSVAPKSSTSQQPHKAQLTENTETESDQLNQRPYNGGSTRTPKPKDMQQMHLTENNETESDQMNQPPNNGRTSQTPQPKDMQQTRQAERDVMLSRCPTREKKTANDAQSPSPVQPKERDTAIATIGELTADDNVSASSNEEADAPSVLMNRSDARQKGCVEAETASLPNKKDDSNQKGNFLLDSSDDEMEEEEEASVQKDDSNQKDDRIGKNSHCSSKDGDSVGLKERAAISINESAWDSVDADDLDW